MRVLHILHESLPLISGFTIRSKYIFKHQREFAKVFALTTFQFKRKNHLEIIDSIPYFRMNKNLSLILSKYNKFIIRVNNLFYKLFNYDLEKRLNCFLYFPVSFFTKSFLKKIIKLYKIDVIHQHSQYQIGNYTQQVAKEFKIPYVYEVRGFIEESMIATSKNRRFRDKKMLKYVYNRIRNQETKILKKSDSIITLSEPMKVRIINRGIKKEKLSVVPNCIDIEILKCEENKIYNQNQRDSAYDLVIGYFGQIRWLEGIEFLIKAIPLLLKENIKVQVLLIGNIKQPYLNFLNQLINQLKISPFIKFLGSMPHNEVIKYYSQVDIIALPRLNNRVSRIVTPLKPLEAMGFKTLVIASNLPALKYTIIDKKTGALFKPEDHEDLASKIIYYYKNPAEKKTIEEYAYKYVQETFSWKKNITKYKEIYENLIY